MLSGVKTYADCCRGEACGTGRGARRPHQVGHSCPPAAMSPFPPCRVPGLNRMSPLPHWPRRLLPLPWQQRSTGACKARPQRRRRLAGRRQAGLRMLGGAASTVNPAQDERALLLNAGMLSGFCLGDGLCCGRIYKFRSSFGSDGVLLYSLCRLCLATALGLRWMHRDTPALHNKVKCCWRKRRAGVHRVRPGWCCWCGRNGSPSRSTASRRQCGPG